MKRIIVLAVALLVAGSACGVDEGEPAALAGEPPSTIGETLPDAAASVPDATSPTTSETATASSAPPGPAAAELNVSKVGSVGELQKELAAGQVRLWVSNQSFDDDFVSITIRIDGEVVVDDSFAVGSQHNWISYDIAGVSAGTHLLVGESDTGARTEGEFTVLAGASLWLVADYWYSSDGSAGRYFTFFESDEPVVFA